MRGHVRKRGNTWSVVVDLGVDTEGRRRQKWHSGYRTKKEAGRAVTEILARLQSGTYVEPTRQTVASYLHEWLSAIKSTVRSGTWRSYATNVDRHVIPRLGHLPLRQIGAVQLNTLYAELLADGRCDGGGGLSARTVRYTHTILHRAFRDAVRWGILARNPADLADPPRHARPEMHVWSTGELRQFLSFVAEDDLYPVWLLLATTGLRRGEALGLRWDDVDFDARRISIQQTLASSGGKLMFSPPKTAKSRRSLTLDEATLQALRNHRRSQLEVKLLMGPAYADQRLVFARPDGSPLRPDSVSRRFGELTREAGLPTIRVHDLRHTYATIALTAGTHPKVVAERLGHATIAVTLDTYSHVLPSLEEESATRLAELILGRN